MRKKMRKKLAMRRLIVASIILLGCSLLLFPQSAHADTGRAYVTNGGGNSVSVIDMTTNTVVATIPVGVSPRSAVVSRDGRHVYVSNFTVCCSVGPGTVSVI